MLKAFGWAVRQLFYVLTVLRCRQIPPQSPLPLRHRLLSLCAICIGEMKWLLYEWERYAGLICSCWCVSERKVEDLIGEVGWVVSRFCWIWRSEVLVMLSQKSKKEKQREDLQQSNPRYQTKKTKWFFFPFGTDENTHDCVIPSYKLILVCLCYWINNKQPPSRQAVKQANL